MLRISVGLLFILVSINQLEGQLASCVCVCVCNKEESPAFTSSSPSQNEGWITKQAFSIVCFLTLGIGIVVCLMSSDICGPVVCCAVFHLLFLIQAGRDG